MQLKDGFILRNIADTWLVVPIGSRVVDFNGLITLSETGAFLWEALTRGNAPEDLASLLLADYDVDEATASADVADFLEQLKNGGLLV